MLVLTRKYGESIDVDGKCKVTILKVMKNSVKVGFEGPTTTKVLRSEIVEKEKANDDTN